MKIADRFTGITFSILLLVVLVGCKGQQGTISSGSGEGLQPEDVIGSWSAREVEIELISKSNGKQDSSYTVDARERAAKMGCKPVLTIIQPDGEYREETRTIGDSLLRSANGYWHIYSDTLIFRLRGEQAAEKRYHAIRKGNKLNLSSSGDFDGDSKNDDRWNVVLEKE